MVFVWNIAPVGTHSNCGEKHCSRDIDSTGVARSVSQYSHVCAEPGK